MANGSAVSDLVWFLGILLVLAIGWFVAGGPDREAATAGPVLAPPPPLGTGEIFGPRSGAGVGEGGEFSSPPAGSSAGDANSTGVRISPWSGHVTIEMGNAAYEKNAGAEYTVLSAAYDNREAVNISGWQLANSPVRQPRVAVTIPSAARLFSAAEALATLEPILLPPGGRAVIVSGNPPSSNRWPAKVAFRVNACLGYLERELSAFRLAPSFSRSCPDPEKEPGAALLDDDCYEFVSRLPWCQTPKFERLSDGTAVVDGQPDTLTSSCRRFVEEHFSYDGCLNWHQADPDFYTDEWRVYLNRPWELWAENRETISLSDAQGRLVAERSY